MNLFRDLKIATKLGLGFFVVLLLMAIMGAVALSEMSKVNDQSTEIATNWMPSINFIHETNTATSDYRIAELNHVLAETPEQMALFMLANHVLSPEYFHQLRTEQQLGYLVGTGYVPINTLPGIAFYVQSPNTHCEQLYEATIMFFRAFLADTETMSTEDFAEIKQGLLAQLHERDNSLGARAKRYWLALGQEDHQFSLNEQIATALSELQLQQFIVFLQQLLLPDYDAIFLATDGKPEHSHLQFTDAASLKQRLAQA